LLQAGCPDGEMREKVYRFINKYSHNQVIDINDGPIDNLLGEGNSIVQSVLKILENLDPDHYSEMVEVCE
jgi:wobble nucleotide-excising tRNase